MIDEIEKEINKREQNVRDFKNEIKKVSKSDKSFSEIGVMVNKLEDAIEKEEKKIDKLKEDFEKEIKKKTEENIKKEQEKNKKNKKEDDKAKDKKEDDKGEDSWDNPKYLGKHLRCTACMYATDRTVNFETHLKSKKHLKNMEIDAKLLEIEKYKSKPEEAPKELKDKKGRLKHEFDLVDDSKKKHRCEVCNMTFNSTTELKRHLATQRHIDAVGNEKYNSVKGMTELVSLEKQIVNKYKSDMKKIDEEHGKNNYDNNIKKLEDERNKTIETIKDYKEKLDKVKKTNIAKSSLSVSQISTLIDNIKKAIQKEDDKIKNINSKIISIKKNRDIYISGLTKAENGYEKNSKRLARYEKHLANLKSNPKNILNNEEVKKLTSFS